MASLMQHVVHKDLIKQHLKQGLFSMLFCKCKRNETLAFLVYYYYSSRLRMQVDF